MIIQGAPSRFGAAVRPRYEERWRRARSRERRGAFAVPGCAIVVSRRDTDSADRSRLKALVTRRCACCARSRSTRIVDQLPHALRGECTIRLGPLRIGRVGVVAGTDVDQFVGDEIGVRRIHEHQIATVRGRNGRHAECDRVGEIQRQPFAAVQRDDSGCGGQQGRVVRGRELRGEQVDVGARPRRVHEALVVVRSSIRVAALEQELGAVVGGERLGVRGHGAQRVLAVDDTEIVPRRRRR